LAVVPPVFTAPEPATPGDNLPVNATVSNLNDVGHDAIVAVGASDDGEDGAEDGSDADAADENGSDGEDAGDSGAEGGGEARPGAPRSGSAPGSLGVVQ